MTTFPMIRVDFNQLLDTLVKYNNNLIGATAREKIHDACEYVSDWTIAAGTLVQNYDWAYKGKACIKATVAAGVTAEVSRSFATAVNILEYSTALNNFATVHDTGRFTTMSGLMAKVMSTGQCQIKLRVYCGAAKYAEWKSWVSITNAADARFRAWQTMAKTIVWTEFDSFGGFDQNNDFEAITKISVMIYNPTAAAIDAYIQEIKTIDILHTDTEASDVYVSKIFGDDANSGLRKDQPVKTIARGIALATAGHYKVKIIDSETYKEDLTINKAFLIELLPTLGEHPVVCADDGVVNKERLGARKDYRRAFYRGTGTKRYVAKSGADANAGTDPALPKLTIQNAITASATGDCIEILDNGVYDETFQVLDKIITIQAAPLMTPVMKRTSGARIMFVFNSGAVGGTTGLYIYGITLQGSGVTTTTGIGIEGLTNDTSKIIDCSFKDIGLGLTLPNVVSHVTANYSPNLYIENCFHTEIIGASMPTLRLGGSLGSGIKHVENCFAYLDNLNIYYQNEGNLAGDVSTINIIGCEVEVRRPYATPEAYLYYIDNSTIYAGTTTLTIKFCKGGRILDIGNAAAHTSYIKYNNVSGIVNNFDDGVITSTSYAYIYGNRVKSNAAISFLTANGIYITGDAPARGRTYVANNVVTGFSNAGIKIEDDRNIISVNNNIVDTNTACGIYNSGTHGTKTIANNIVTGSAVGAESTNALTISQCLLYNNTANIGGSAVLSACVTGVSSEVYDIDNDKYVTAPKSVGREYGSSRYDIGLYELDGGSLITMTTQSNIYYMNIQGNNIVNGIYMPVGTSKVFYNTIHDCREGVLSPNGATSAVYGVKSNVLTDNGVGISNKAWHKIEKNLIYGNVFGIASKAAEIYHNTITENVTGFSELFITNDIKDNIIYGNTVIDYDGAASTDYNIINTRATADSAGPNDINKDPLFIDDEMHVANIYVGYDLNSPAFRSASDSKDRGAQVDCIIRATVEKETYTFKDNPIDFVEYKVPLFMNESDVFNGDLNQNVETYVKEILMTWQDNALIDETMKENLKDIFASVWVVTFYFDGVTPTYYKVKKQNQFSVKRFKYIHDEFPFGNVSLLVREIPGFDITDFALAEF